MINTMAILPTKARTLSVKLDPSYRERLGGLASMKKRTAHYLMREAIEQYIEREEARQAVIADAKAAWEDYRQTGLHITLDEFEAWVEAIEENPNAAVPICHE